MAAALLFHENHATEEAMTKKHITKPRKRGPKEERLIVREDPQDALARLLKPAKAKPTK
jgi:hypothetical protein